MHSHNINDIYICKLNPVQGTWTSLNCGRQPSYESELKQVQNILLDSKHASYIMELQRTYVRDKDCLPCFYHTHPLRVLSLAHSKVLHLYFGFYMHPFASSPASGKISQRHGSIHTIFSDLELGSL